MKRIIIIWSVLGVILACHYSCLTCTGSQYTTCLTCPNGNITVVQDPATLPQAYWPSLYPIGTCVDTLGGKANALGIVLFIILSACLLVGGSKEGLYLYLTIQTWGLYSFVEIAWLNPIGYLLQGLQYFMIWNVLGSNIKTTTDYTLQIGNYYRLNQYIKQTGLVQNIVLIAAFTLLAMVLLIIICIIAIRRKKQPPAKQ